MCRKQHLLLQNMHYFTVITACARHTVEWKHPNISQFLKYRFYSAKNCPGNAATVCFGGFTCTCCSSWSQRCWGRRAESGRTSCSRSPSGLGSPASTNNQHEFWIQHRQQRRATLFYIVKDCFNSFCRLFKHLCLAWMFCEHESELSDKLHPPFTFIKQHNKVTSLWRRSFICMFTRIFIHFVALQNKWMSQNHDCYPHIPVLLRYTGALLQLVAQVAHCILQWQMKPFESWIMKNWCRQAGA